MSLNLGVMNKRFRCLKCGEVLFDPTPHNVRYHRCKKEMDYTDYKVKR